MSNFMSYENAQSVLGEFAEAIKSGGGGGGVTKEYVAEKTVKNYLPYPYAGIAPYQELQLETGLSVKDHAPYYGNVNADLGPDGILYALGNPANDCYIDLTYLIPLSDKKFNTFRGKVFSAVMENGSDVSAKPAIRVYSKTASTNYTYDHTINADAYGKIVITEEEPPAGTVYAYVFAIEFEHLEDAPEPTIIYDSISPMICDADLSISNWQPYAKEQHDLTVSAVPAGAIMPFGGSSAPFGWLLCNGAAVSRTDYADLFAVIGTSYGTGDNSTTFNVPDLRECVPVGAGQSERSSSVLKSHDTYTVGQFKDDQFQDHTHKYTRPYSGTGSLYISGSCSTASTYDTTTYSAVVTNTTYRGGTVTRGKRLGVNYIIKT